MLGDGGSWPREGAVKMLLFILKLLFEFVCDFGGDWKGCKFVGALGIVVGAGGAGRLNFLGGFVFSSLLVVAGLSPSRNIFVPRRFMIGIGFCFWTWNVSLETDLGKL